MKTKTERHCTQEVISVILEAEVIQDEILEAELLAEVIQTNGKIVQIGNGLKLENNVLSVDTADKVEQDNGKPVTSAAVFTGLDEAFIPLSNIEIDEILNKFM